MFLIELPKPKSYEVIASFENDFFSMTESLDIEKNRLVLLNPNRRIKKSKNRIKLKAIEREKGS